MTLLKWRLFGVAEGEISEILDQTLSTMNCTTGYRLEMPYLEFKVRCLPQDANKIQAIIEPLIQPHTIATTTQKASEKLKEKIKALSVPIEILDGITGGKLQRLIQTPSTYPFLHFFANGEATIHFQLLGLDAYWQQKDAKTTDITIKYDGGGKHGSETHTLPYRNANVVLYAAEWLCFRLLHLIDQLH